MARNCWLVEAEAPETARAKLAVAGELHCLDLDLRPDAGRRLAGLGWIHAKNAPPALHPPANHFPYFGGLLKNVHVEQVKVSRDASLRAHPPTARRVIRAAKVL